LEVDPVLEWNPMKILGKEDDDLVLTDEEDKAAVLGFESLETVAMERLDSLTDQTTK